MSLADALPELAAQWHPTRNDVGPDEVGRGSASVVWWVCPAGHEWQAAVHRRAIGRGCPTCSGRGVVAQGHNLATVRPELAAEWHPTLNGSLTPDRVAPQSNKRVWWVCRQGHEWRSSIDSRYRGHGCPVCSGLTATDETCLATLFPDIAAQWHPSRNAPLTADDVTPGSARRVWWLCGVCGREWATAVGNRTKGTGCPSCAPRGPRGTAEAGRRREDTALG